MPNNSNPSPFTWALAFALAIAALSAFALVYFASAGGASATTSEAEGRVSFRELPVRLGVWSVNVKKGEFIECLVSEVDDEIDADIDFVMRPLIGGDPTDMRHGREHGYISIRGDSHTADEVDGTVLRYYGVRETIHDCVLYEDAYDWTDNRRFEKEMP